MQMDKEYGKMFFTFTFIREMQNDTQKESTVTQIKSMADKENNFERQN